MSYAYVSDYANRVKNSTQLHCRFWKLHPGRSDADLGRIVVEYMKLVERLWPQEAHLPVRQAPDRRAVLCDDRQNQDEIHGSLLVWLGVLEHIPVKVDWLQLGVQV